MTGNHPISAVAVMIILLFILSGIVGLIVQIFEGWGRLLIFPLIPPYILLVWMVLDILYRIGRYWP